MAKRKRRTPPPPRRAQGPTQRAVTPGFDPSGRHRAVLYAFSASGAIGLVVVILVIALTGGRGGAAVNAQGVAAAMKTAGCTFRTVNASVPGGQTHVPSLTAKLPWNTSPPSNGQHYPEWAVWGFYTTAVNPRQVVHNEEHGGVVLWWGPQVPASTVSALRALYDASPTAMFGTPYPSLGAKVAITAWTGNPRVYQQNGYFGQGHIAVCPRWNTATSKAFVAFRDAYRGHGPEGVPTNQDKPGMGPPGAMTTPAG